MLVVKYQSHGLLWPLAKYISSVVKISPCMSQKWLRFGDDVGAHNFMKFAKKYHQQQEECTNIGRLTVYAASPPLVQMLAEYCRKTT